MMNKKLLAMIVALVFAGAAAAGDPAAGKAKTATCVACHAEDGNSPSPAFPNLAGQNERYLIKQMEDIKSGARPVPTMMGQLDNMSEQDLRDIAAYYASQQAAGGQADPALVELGERIYRGGISERAVPSCAGCHSPTGQGNAPAGFPMLAGQHAQYTAEQLRSYRAAADGDPDGRSNDGEDTQIMRTISFRLSDREIEAVSSYIQGLH